MEQNIGLTGKNKNLQELERRAAGIQVDYDFYSIGFNFDSVEPKSANHLFGNGKWKKTIIDALGENTFSSFCEKYGNKPIDFKIAAIKTPQAQYFAFNETINVNDESGNYAGTHKVVGSEPGAIFIMVPYKGEQRGKVTNISRKQGAEKALKKNQQMLNDLKPTVTIQQKKYSNMDEESTSMIQDDAENAAFWGKEKSKKAIKIAAIVGGSILLIAVAFYMYKKYKK